MRFEIKRTASKEESVYKTIYVKRKLASRIEQIAREYETSFNNVIISMLETCFKSQISSGQGKTRSFFHDEKGTKKSFKEPTVP